jgi:Transposase domain (DUF772)
MAANYLPYDPQQMLLLPEALQDWLPEGHLARFIGDTVDAQDLSAFHARYDKDGPRNQPLHPAMMVKVPVYGYATGVFSSHKIARKLHVAFRVLAAGNFPAHRTIREFRAFHLMELSDLWAANPDQRASELGPCRPTPTLASAQMFMRFLARAASRRAALRVNVADGSGLVGHPGDLGATKPSSNPMPVRGSLAGDWDTRQAVGSDQRSNLALQRVDAIKHTEEPRMP